MTKKVLEYPKADADLVEATPAAGGLWHWILASPALLFLAWNWIALLDTINFTGNSSLNILLGCISFIALIVLPLGYLAHRFVTGMPRLFQAAGWEIKPRKEIPEAELFTTRYTYRDKQRSATSWHRIWLRTAQGWVYLEIAAIFIGAILLIPLFFSALQFGFGQ